MVRWCFTDYGGAGTNGSELVPEAWKELPEGVRYMTWQLERGEKQGKLHHQGYLELEKAQYVSWLHLHISKTAGFIVAKGTGKQNFLYTHKTDTRSEGPWTLGEMKTPDPGGFHGLVDAIIKGARYRDLIFSHPAMMARYPGFYWKVREAIHPERTTALQVILALGDTGSGKTKWGTRQYKSCTGGFWKMPVSNGTVWFNGYDGHSVAQWDESSGRFSSMKLTALLEYLDDEPILVPIKQGFTWWMPDIIYLTTNIPPWRWYNFTQREFQRAALKRRFTRVLDFTGRRGPDWRKGVEGPWQGPMEVNLDEWEWPDETMAMEHPHIGSTVNPLYWGNRRSQ